MKIAVISDLHFGPGARSEDLCPLELRAKTSGVSSSGADGFCKQFIEFVEREKISADYLLVPGDVTDDAHPMEVQAASDFLKDAQKALRVPAGKVLFVPGNHDVDWDLLDRRDTTKVKWLHRYMALEASQFIFSHINGNGLKDGDLFAGNYFNLWEFENLIVLGYNSSGLDTGADKGLKGNVEQAHVDHINQILKKRKYKSDKRIKVFLIHHHLRDFKLPLLKDRDFSQANNPESIISVLQNHNFNFIIHGHRHYSFFDAQNSQIPILCAGSFSAKIDDGWEGLVLNQFHIVEIQDLKSSRIGSSGLVHSWSYTMKGWKKSPGGDSFGGEPYERSFGTSLGDKTLAKKLKSCLTKLRGERNNIRWHRDVLPRVDAARYLSENRERIIEWCRDEVFSDDSWDVFPRGEDDIFFAKN